jgi:inhibitor of cysteine peptidase
MPPVLLSSLPERVSGLTQTSDVTGLKSASAVSTTISATINQEFEIVLEGVPTAGYVWELGPATDKEAVVQELGHEWKRSTWLVGGPSQEHFRFLALREGEVNLHFRYRRPWEKGIKAERVFHIRVTKA